MNPAVKELWVEALESGRYVQGFGTLTRRDASGDKDCCLGVLCKLAVAAGVILEGREVDIGHVVLSYDGDVSGVLPPAVMQWAGLIKSDPDFGDWSLADYNDGHYRDGGVTLVQYDFAQIAGLIRDHF